MLPSPASCLRNFSKLIFSKIWAQVHRSFLLALLVPYFDVPALQWYEHTNNGVSR